MMLMSACYSSNIGDKAAKPKAGNLYCTSKSADGPGNGTYNSLGCHTSITDEVKDAKQSVVVTVPVRLTSQVGS